MKDQICKLVGTVQHYAWGGFEFIPSLLNQPNVDHKPFAEYWLGAHPSAPSEVQLAAGTSIFLNDAIAQLPFKFVGEEVYNRFGGLPYLLKVLDVKEMLSIQVHPTKEEAEKGFEREEAAGIPINAPHRNYKDKNHKPEVMVALSDFWLLHGFKPEAELRKILQSVPLFTGLENLFERDGYYGLYKHLMEMPQSDADKMLRPLVLQALAGDSDRSTPEYWVRKLYQHNVPASNFDRGIFSIYLFNIVHLKPGQAIFQGAGLPHAYLEGQNVELMANSDNVLRGGLTPKHIDVPELLKHTHFDTITPQILDGVALDENERNYPLPSKEFGISQVSLTIGQQFSGRSYSAEIFIVMDGTVSVDGQVFEKGDAFIVTAEESYTLTTPDSALLYKAFVPASDSNTTEN